MEGVCIGGWQLCGGGSGQASQATKSILYPPLAIERLSVLALFVHGPHIVCIAPQWGTRGHGEQEGAPGKAALPGGPAEVPVHPLETAGNGKHMEGNIKDGEEQIDCRERKKMEGKEPRRQTGGGCQQGATT